MTKSQSKKEALAANRAARVETEAPELKVVADASAFAALGLIAPIVKALAAEGYSTPTPIQTQAIPIVLKGRDLIGLAQTGTGKTAAFALPIIQRLNENRRHAGEKACRTLVLAPTRELASQIADSFRAYGRFVGLSTAVVFGGASMFKQKQALYRGVDVLVATPGRLLDHISQRSLRLDQVEILVLDEADHMLDMGFIHDLRRIATLVPKKRQSLFFSATMPEPIAELAAQFLSDPLRVAVTPPSTTAERVEQAVIHVDHSRKQDLLHALLGDKSISRALVFARTKHGADRVVRKLQDAGFAADAIHGNKSQGQRERALDAFKKGKARVLVATEIAARGIDVDEVSHVINFDLPNVPEQYVHRIGRTARAGSTGMAISFCAPDERAYLKDLQRLTKQDVPVMKHELSLPTPKADDRTPKPRPQGQKQPRPQQRARGPAKHHASDAHDRGQRKPSHARDETAKRGDDRPRETGARNNAARDNASRDTGDRRDRKGNNVWSNSGPAPNYRKQRKPPRG